MPRGKHNGHVRGSRHPRWNGEPIVGSQGYVKVRVGAAHPLADPEGYAYEHLVVWCAAGNDRPSAGEIVHHVNGDKRDNRIENLELMTRSAHTAHHVVDLRRDDRGRFLPSENAA